MSEIKYGLISRTDANTIEKTIDLICESFPNEVVNVTEIGLYSGQSSEAISKYISLVKHRVFFYTGIDNGKDGEELKHFPDFNSRLILGNSTEVYNQIPDESQHLIFIDGDHSKIGVIADFFAYKNKVKVGGYIAFHDTGRHIKPFTDFQHGDKGNPEAYISVRAALEEIGILLPDHPENKKTLHTFWHDWEKVFDEADADNNAGGICCFRRLF